MAAGAMVSPASPARSVAAAAAVGVPSAMGKQSEARQGWARASTIVALAALGVAAITATVAAWAAHRRRRARGFGGDQALEDEDVASSGAATPTGLGDPPRAGPEEVGAEYLAAEEQRAERHAALDEGLRALGMLSSSGPAAANGAAGRQRPHVARGANAQPYLEDGVEGAEDTFVVERVSQEEEERRYFANMAGGFDLFDGIAEAEQPQRRRPVVAYEGQ